MHMYCMPTTVRVEDDVKTQLDRLQGLVQHDTGQRLSQSELLAKLLRFASKRSDLFFESLGEPEWAPPTPAEMKRLFGKVKDWGVATDSSRLDEELYGKREE